MTGLDSGDHIRSFDDENKSFCGEELQVGKFHFRDVEAAVVNGMHKNERTACFKCTQTVMNFLRNGSV